jgi:hypothetical protein
MLFVCYLLVICLLFAFCLCCIFRLVLISNVEEAAEATTGHGAVCCYPGATKNGVGLGVTVRGVLWC